VSNILDLQKITAIETATEIHDLRNGRYYRYGNVQTEHNVLTDGTTVQFTNSNVIITFGGGGDMFVTSDLKLEHFVKEI